MAETSEAPSKIWTQFLSAHTTADIPQPKSVVEISSEQTPSQGFETLLQNRILSAPVWCVEEKKYVGFLDMRDFVSFVVFFYHSQAEGGASFVNIMREGLKTFNTPVDGISVTYLARRHQFRPVPVDSTLAEVVQRLSKNVARVPVVNSEGKVVQIISQSALVSFLDKQKHLPFNNAIQDLDIGGSPVISVNKDTSAIETFKTLEVNNRSGIAILDEQGKICSATSARDLKGFLANPSIERLSMPIFEFLKQIRRESIDIAAPTITVEMADSLRLCVGKLAATRVHRVFIVDGNTSYKPIRVISVKDVVTWVSRQLAAEASS
eukprot:TRINITY_DN2062_c0_g1_i1.p1 TRINITY_DN2062_c0_g1~~TRINITY_DN2062_c0_g1_i1.p1  ORF type:complete len:322 (-),score=100.34 TRINITY_DN2062_c0_g1_i1:82-1047(-)